MEEHQNTAILVLPGYPIKDILMIKDLAENGYVLFKVPSAHEVEPCFDSLSIDPYYGNYRYKAVSRFNFINGKVIMLPHADFFQSKDYNPIAGNVTRHYPPIDEWIVKSRYLHDLFEKISEQVHLLPKTCFTVHQIRVVSSENQEGLAAAEGIHQDGFDFVAIGCISRKNIEGGITSLYSETKEQVFTKELHKEDVLFFNDRKLFHYTSPINNINSDQGSRDVVVITVSLNGVSDVPEGSSI